MNCISKDSEIFLIPNLNELNTERNLGIMIIDMQNRYLETISRKK